MLKIPFCQNLWRCKSVDNPPPPPRPAWTGPQTLLRWCIQVSFRVGWSRLTEPSGPSTSSVEWPCLFRCTDFPFFYNSLKFPCDYTSLFLCFFSSFFIGFCVVCRSIFFQSRNAALVPKVPQTSCIVLLFWINFIVIQQPLRYRKMHVDS